MQSFLSFLLITFPLSLFAALGDDQIKPAKKGVNDRKSLGGTVHDDHGFLRWESWVDTSKDPPGWIYGRELENKGSSGSSVRESDTHASCCVVTN